MAYALMPRHCPLRQESGFTLLELLISMAILTLISGIMMRGTLDMSRLNAEQSNRSEMHAAIRNATALLQQEVGQAGRVAFPNPVVVSSTAAVGANQISVAQVLPNGATQPSVVGMFPGLNLVLDVGNNEELVTVDQVLGTSQIRLTAGVKFQHAPNARIRPAAGFAAGVIPTTGIDGHTGSTASVLKIVGDINSDGNLKYVEYTCDWDEGRLFRNMMAYNAASKPELTVKQVLLDNLLPNPPDADGTPADCFSYAERTFNDTTYVINVAIMTTVRTDLRDPTTGDFQTVTKALLNVAPRNVFQVWQIASLNYQNRVQPVPPSVLNLLD